MCIHTILPRWINGKVISIEIDSSRALPGIDIIWLPDSAVKESKERLRSAFRAFDIDIPPYRYVINLSPSDIRKSGSLFDIPIAVALYYHIHEKKCITKHIIQTCVFVWELGLDWSIKWVRGILSIVLAAQKEWHKKAFIPSENKDELHNIWWISIHLVSHIWDIIKFLHTWEIETFVPDNTTIWHSTTWYDISFDDIIWQHTNKRAVAVGAAWLHNILMIGPPWTWKSMIAKAIPSILPPLTPQELLEVNQIYSLSGKSQGQYITTRPFRSIHHTASKIAIVGGGPHMTPGELSHAHRWILFLDELPEFPREVLDILRQPLEDKNITISRVHWSITFPAHCMVIWAMNPCICWYYKDTDKTCTCAPNSIKRYQWKLSWPLLDRFDIITEVCRESWIHQQTNTMSQWYWKDKVKEARDRQQHRYTNDVIYCNSQLTARGIKQYISLDEECENILLLAEKKLILSHRAIHKIIKITRTIADIDQSDIIQKEHLLEALQYRSKQMFIHQ